MAQPLTLWQATKILGKEYARRSARAVGNTVRRLAGSSLGNTQGFEGAARNRRLAGWTGSSQHVNSLLTHAGPTMTARARYLTRNSPYAIKGKRSFVGNAIGAGIVPISQAESEAHRKPLDDLFLAWTDEADADGLTDFYGLQSLAAASMFEAGEVFVRFRPRRMSDGLTVPLQLQLIESEQLPLNHSERLANGNVIRSGIEFNRIGKRVAYHFLREHPGDQLLTSFQAGMTVRVPASSVLHLYEVQRPGQIRGQTMLAAALVKTFLLDIYDDAEIDRKKAAALFTGFIRRPIDVEGSINETKPNSDGISFAELSPGTMNVLNEGEEVSFAEPADVGGNYEIFQRRTLLAVAAAMGVPYENVTGDLRNVSYSSIRAGVLEFRRCLEQYQHQIVVYQFCRPTRNRWTDAVALSGALDLPGYADNPKAYWKTEWIPDRWDWVDPLKDREGEKLALEMGTTSRTKVARKEGFDVNQLNEEIAAERADERAKGLSFVHQSGTFNGADENEDDEREDRTSTSQSSEEETEFERVTP